MYTSNKTLTSANAVLQFRCKGIVDEFKTVTSFQADSAFDFGETTLGETVMSIDGVLHGGYVNNQTAFNVHLTPDSPEMDLFERCRNYFAKNQETTKFEFRVSLPSIKKQYSFSGFMISSPNVQATKLLGMGAYVFNTDLSASSEIN